MNRKFWNRKRVFVTGHTGFKGAWLCLWLSELGASVTGYALTPPTNPSLFEQCQISRRVNSVIADIRDKDTLNVAMQKTSPEVVIHMAAQSLVRESYRNPAETYDVNVMGTVTLFEAIRNGKGIRAVINVTTDKCYENREWLWGYRENEMLGGYDPYSNSKACSEMVTAAYRDSFFNPKQYANHGVAIASARAGNVIGGGDWAVDRLIPDCVRALLRGEKVVVRNPNAVRPWQHVLEPLNGYLILAERLYNNGARYSEGWNFGPDEQDVQPVEWIVKAMCSKWGQGASYEINSGEQPHEARYLKLDCSKAKAELEWHPRWKLERAIDSILEWTQAYAKGLDLQQVCLKQIREFEAKGV